MPFYLTRRYMEDGLAVATEVVSVFNGLVMGCFGLVHLFDGDLDETD